MMRAIRFMGAAALAALAVPAAAETFRVTIPATAPQARYDGRLILILSPRDTPEPRFQVAPGHDAPQVIGMNVSGVARGGTVTLTADLPGYPARSLAAVPAGDYHVQAVLHVYDRFKRGDGRTVLLPAARGAGQNWREEPGNIVSTPKRVRFDPARPGQIDIALDRVLPPVAPPKDTPFIRHFRFKSPSLTRFWGRDTYITGHVLVPRDFDKHPEARFPLAIFHGHFPADFGGFRTTPPDADAPCVPNARFGEPCYNRIEQQEAYDFYKKWISPDFPRMLIVEIDHSNPFYDDSYAVNSANLGPYGDAITHEFLPALEAKFRGIGQGWARFLYGGSTGGWSAMAAQIFYPRDYNGAFIGCPDPVDFRHYMVTNIYEERNAYWREGPFGRVAKPAKRNYLGHVDYMAEDENRLEYVLGDKTRSGGQWDIWEAVFSPMGADGYPRPLVDKLSGAIDPDVARHWRDNYDLTHILARDWAKLAPDLQGKLHVYVGDMDNYYLNNAVYTLEQVLNRADPPYRGEVLYGDRAEHCWNGDAKLPNAVSRLRYNSMYVDKILERIRQTAPPGADLTSWRYR